MVLIAIAAVLSIAPLPSPSEPESLPAILLLVFLFGLLGGTMSAIFKVPSAHGSTRIPELTGSITFFMLRLFTGGESAVIVYVFLSSQLAELTFAFFDADYLENSFFIFAVAFVAGFLERLVLTAVEKLAVK